VTDAGTLMEAMLLDNCMSSPPEGAAVLKLTVQESDPVPAALAFAQVRPLNSAFGAEVEPLPWRLTVAAGEADALLITLS